MNVKVLNDKIERATRNIVRVVAVIILCYLAWKGASGFDNHRNFLSYTIVIGLISLVALV